MLVNPSLRLTASYIIDDDFQFLMAFSNRISCVDKHLHSLSFSQITPRVQQQVNFLSGLGYRIVCHLKKNPNYKIIYIFI